MTSQYDVMTSLFDPFRGLNINLVLLADDDEEDNDTLKELGMSAKFDLVVQVSSIGRGSQTCNF